MPEICQIVPLAEGTLFAVTCHTLDRLNRISTALMLFRGSQDAKLMAKPVSTIFIPSSPEVCICPVSSGKPCNPLLASVSAEGRVVLYDCSWDKGLKTLCGFQCRGGEGRGGASSCVYCPTTGQLMVAWRNGNVSAIRFRDQNQTDAACTDSAKEAASDPLDRSLDSGDFDRLLDLVSVSSLGVAFTCSSHVHWKEISLLQLNRKSPVHVNVSPKRVGHLGPGDGGGRGRKENLDNSRILQYNPPLETPGPNRLVQ